MLFFFKDQSLPKQVEPGYNFRLLVIITNIGKHRDDELRLQFSRACQTKCIISVDICCDHFFAVFRLEQLRSKVNIIVLPCSYYYYNFFLVAISGDSLYLFFVNYFAIWLCSYKFSFQQSLTKFPCKRVSNQNWFLGQDQARLGCLVFAIAFEANSIAFASTSCVAAKLKAAG